MEDTVTSYKVRKRFVKNAHAKRLNYSADDIFHIRRANAITCCKSFESLFSMFAWMEAIDNAAIRDMGCGLAPDAVEMRTHHWCIDVYTRIQSGSVEGIEIQAADKWCNVNALDPKYDENDKCVSLYRGERLVATIL